jgi:hypothetical protein
MTIGAVLFAIRSKRGFPNSGLNVGSIRRYSGVTSDAGVVNGSSIRSSACIANCMKILAT